MKEKKISIIIPIYNCKEYISNCVDSIIQYKNENIEVILIDDGSMDGSSEICDDIAKIDTRIKVIHKSNGGVSKARNDGIKFVTGDYLMFVDADDELDADWYKVIQYLEDADIYYFTQQIKSAETKEKMLGYITGFNSEGICFAGPFSKLFKTSFIKGNNVNFDSSLINGEDMLFNIECLIKCDNYENHEISFYNYRKFHGSATKRFDKNIIFSDNHFQKKMKELFMLNRISNELCTKVIDYCLQMSIIVILNRIAYIEKYHEAKEYLFFLENEIYKKVLQNKFLVSKKFSFILNLIKKQKYFLVYKILSIKIKISKKYGKKFYFTKI